MKNHVKICQSQRIPGAYWDTTRSRKATAKEMLRAFILSFAISSPVAAACILRIVMAVADGVGKMSRSSRATYMMKNFRSGVAKKKPK